MGRNERKVCRSFQLKAGDRGEGSVRFSTLNAKDHDGDWTLPGAFPDGKAVPLSGWGHSSWGAALPPGRAIVHADGTADVKFFLSTEAGREHFETLKALGDLARYSYAFNVLEVGDVTPEMRQAGVKRVLKRLDVFELSPVLLPAGVGTGTLALKCQGCGGSTEACTCGGGHARQLQREAIDAEMVRFRQITEAFKRATEPPPEPSVHPLTRQFATRVARFAAERLGIDPPTVRFFPADGRRWGYVSPRWPETIFLSDALPETATPDCLGHECQHLLDMMRGVEASEERADLAGIAVSLAWAMRDQSRQ